MSEDGPLQLYEVGSFGELCRRPNPEGYVVLTVPDFASILPFIIQRAGESLSAEEIEKERSKAASIVVPRDAAERIVAERAAK